MKLVFFIGNKKLYSFSFNKIIARQAYKLIALVCDKTYHTISAETRTNFDLIHAVKSSGSKLLMEFDFKHTITLINEDIKVSQIN